MFLLGKQGIQLNRWMFEDGIQQWFECQLERLSWISGIYYELIFYHFQQVEDYFLVLLIIALLLLEHLQFVLFFFALFFEEMVESSN